MVERRVADTGPRRQATLGQIEQPEVGPKGVTITKLHCPAHQPLLKGIERHNPQNLSDMSDV
jgi:hypothetical protein